LRRTFLIGRTRLRNAISNGKIDNGRM